MLNTSFYIFFFFKVLFFRVCLLNKILAWFKVNVIIAICHEEKNKYDYAIGVWYVFFAVVHKIYVVYFFVNQGYAAIQATTKI